MQSRLPWLKMSQSSFFNLLPLTPAFLSDTIRANEIYSQQEALLGSD